MIEKLQQIGFSRKESEIFFALAKQEEATANEMAKETSTNRTVCYNVLEQLIKKGVVSYVTKNKKRFFSVANPSNLLTAIKEKETITKDIVISLEKLRRSIPIQRAVEVFEGKDGLKQIFSEIRQCKEMDVLNATGLIYENLEFSAQHIINDINKSRKVRVIGVESMKKTPLSKNSRAQIKYLPKEAENYATTFLIDGKVIIITLKEKPFLIKISEPSIFEGYKKDFKVLWDKL
jgi:sugar-specific transcriptional regulator TrmB